MPALKSSIFVNGSLLGHIANRKQTAHSNPSLEALLWLTQHKDIITNVTDVKIYSDCTQMQSVYSRLL